MATSGTGDGITENPSNSNAQERKEDGRRKKISEYEICREARIKENLERMQKLGIFDLSLKVKAFNKTASRGRKTPYSRSTPPHSSPLPPSGPVRRSSRLQNATPVSYSEAFVTKKDKALESKVDFLREEGSRPEIYTEEHEKLLGSTEMAWTLFVDGVGKDGKRIYDPVKGKTCHQCRQKTLGHRTHCSRCNLVQGQFCGDCLYMRYGENVLEANQNPNWICPVCRGICNCSLCRQAKGWLPTGSLYRKISTLGYKSVAHYLIQTRRAKPEKEADSNSKVPVSAKRALPFADVEEISEEMDLMNSNTNPNLLNNPECEVENPENLHCDKQEEEKHFFNNKEADIEQVETRHLSNENQGDGKQEVITDFTGNEQGDCNVDMEMKLECPAELNGENSSGGGPRGNVLVNMDGLPISSHDQERAIHVELQNSDSHHKFNSKKDNNASNPANTDSDRILAPESSPKSNKKRVRTIQPSSSCKAGRLKTRHNRENEQDVNGLSPAETKADVNNANSCSKATITENVAGILRKNHAAVGNEPQINKSSSSAATTIGTSSEPSPDSIAGRLRQRRMQARGA